MTKLTSRLYMTPTHAFYDAQATCCGISSDGFAQAVTDTMISVLPTDETWRMHISGSTPPYDDLSGTPAGHIQITLLSRKKSMTLGCVLVSRMKMV